MNPYIDLSDPSRTRVREAARRAGMALAGARTVLTANGYEQIRIDQYQHPVTKTLVETGYVYGETRLVVHVQHEDWVSPEKVDFRLTGGDRHQREIDLFCDLVVAGAGQ